LVLGVILKAGLGDAAKHVPSRSIPNVVVRIGSVFNKEFRPIVPDLGFARKMTSRKANLVLRWQPRNPEDAVLASAESLIKKALVKA
jgi:hypothetical protein